VALVAGTARGTPSVVLLPVWDQCGATCCRLTSMSKRLLGLLAQSLAAWRNMDVEEMAARLLDMNDAQLSAERKAYADAKGGRKCCA